MDSSQNRWRVVRDYVVAEGLRGTSRNAMSLSRRRSRGMPRTRSLITFRAISVVPPPIQPDCRMRKPMALWRLCPVDPGRPRMIRQSQGHRDDGRADVPLNNRTSPPTARCDRPDPIGDTFGHLFDHQLEHARLADLVQYQPSSSRPAPWRFLTIVLLTEVGEADGLGHEGRVIVHRSWNIHRVPPSIPRRPRRSDRYPER